MTTLNTRFFLLGYSGYLLPRPMRRLLARTQMHRAWLAGDMGIFKKKRFDKQPQMGVCDRPTIIPRKGPLRAPATLEHIVSNLMYPYGK